MLVLSVILNWKFEFDAVSHWYAIHTKLRQNPSSGFQIDRSGPEKRVYLWDLNLAGCDAVSLGDLPQIFGMILIPSSLKALLFYVTSGTTHQTPRRHIPQDLSLQISHGFAHLYRVIQRKPFRNATQYKLIDTRPHCLSKHGQWDRHFQLGEGGIGKGPSYIFAT
jgi:hypothetical protein